MATLNQRIEVLEQHAPCKVFTAHQLATCTDEQLLDIFLASAYSDGSHEKYVATFTNNEGVHHGK